VKKFVFGGNRDGKPGDMSNEVGHVKSRSKCFSASPATPEHPARRNVYRALSPDGAFVFALTELLGPFPFIFVVRPTKHVCGHERP